MTPNKPLQRSVTDKVLGRGRECAAPSQVRRARVQLALPTAAERDR